MAGKVPPKPMVILPNEDSSLPARELTLAEMQEVCKMARKSGRPMLFVPPKISPGQLARMAKPNEFVPRSFDLVSKAFVEFSSRAPGDNFKSESFYLQLYEG